MQSTTIKAGQGLYDVVQANNGSIEGLMAFLQLNDFDINSEVVPGALMQLDASVLDPLNLQYNESRSPLYVHDRYVVNTSTSQELFDVCLQETGSLEGVLAFMLTAGIEDINELQLPETLNCLRSQVYDRNAVKIMKSRGQVIATNKIEVISADIYVTIEFNNITIEDNTLTIN